MSNIKINNESFSNLDELLTYILNTNRDNLIKLIIFNKCVFNFDFDIEDFISFTSRNYYDLKRVNFMNITFNGNVELNHYIQDDILTKLELELSFINVSFCEEFRIHGYEINSSIEFVKCTFHKKAEFEENIFKDTIRLLESKFVNDVSFAYSKFKKRIVLFGREKIDKIMFLGNVSFWGSEINDARFWDLEFNKDLTFVNAIFNCPVYFNRSIFKGKITFGSVETIGSTSFRSNIYFDSAKIKELELYNILFDIVVSFNEAQVDFVKIENVIFSKGCLSLSGVKIKQIADEQTARLLKNEAQRSGNEFMALDFKSKELSLHDKRLNYRNNFKEKIPLFFLHWSNLYGADWRLGILFVLVIWVVFFSTYIILRDGIGDVFIWTNLSYIKEAVDFLWVLNGTKELNNISSFWPIIPFLIGKILIGYGIYQTIAAFRKHGR